MHAGGDSHLIVSHVCQEQEGKEAKQRAEHDGSHGGVSSISLTQRLLDESVAIELRNCEQGATGNIKSGVTEQPSVRVIAVGKMEKYGTHAAVYAAKRKHALRMVGRTLIVVYVRAIRKGECEVPMLSEANGWNSFGSR